MTDVPESLHELGSAFVPIPPREKAAERSRTPENLLAADDPVLEAYLREGHNYGVVCREDLAVLDVDDPEALADVIDALPETAWQVSGSGEGEHYFLRVPGFDADLPLDDPETGENIGHVKGAPQSYVVGPGSIHPSGGRYGPLQGGEIATMEEADLRDVLEPYIRERQRTTRLHPTVSTGKPPENTGMNGISVYEILSRGRYPEGERRGHPFHGSDTGANFMVDEGGETFRCWRHDCTGNALYLVGIQRGIISCGEWLPSGLDADTWSEIFDAAREIGFDLPEWHPDGEPIALLPGVRDLTGWDWQKAGRRSEDDLSIDEARERTRSAIATVLDSADRVLIEALPTMGKSYGTIAAAAETEEPITVLTGRGRKEQYEQIREWCQEHGLSYYTLPSFARDCDTANGEHGDGWSEKARDWYRRGATPKVIHKYAENELGRPLPCQEHEAHECPYTAKWRFDPDDVDVLIGHYTHAHKRKATQGRTVILDEFPGSAYETALGHQLAGAITDFLQRRDGLPFVDYADLIEGRHDHQRRADALLWFEEHGVELDETAPFNSGSGHAAARLAVFTLLTSEDLENGWERADVGDGRIGLYDRQNDRVVLLTPPPLEYTRGTIALDGTPTREMWELALGVQMNHRPILTEQERREYVEDVLELNLVRTTEAVKPYNSAEHVAVEQDAALLEAIRENHGECPALITTATAEAEYDAAGVLDLVDEHEHYGNVLGSNKFARTRLGAVIGSQHYGDRYLEQWGAFAGRSITRGEGKGRELTYGTFGDQILTHMREHETLQAAMRFGRDGNGATVYVHTNTLPEWVPLAGEGRVIQTWSSGMKQVIEAARDLEQWTTAELAVHPAIEISERQVRTHLHRLVERGYLNCKRRGSGYLWSEAGLEGLHEYGETEFTAEEDSPWSSPEGAEGARRSTYTWNFQKSPRKPCSQFGNLAITEEYHGNPDEYSGIQGPPPPP